MSGVATSRVELAKIGAQRRTVVAAVICFLGPLAAGVTFHFVSGLPKDTLFGRHIHESGYALPLVVLGFAATWGLPLLASVVAGDVFSGEDAAGTWGLLLTRSATRGSVFTGKVVAGSAAALGLLGAATAGSLLGGFVLTGGGPLIGLGGQELRPGTALALVLASWASVVPAVLCWAALALLLSVVTRSSVVGIGGGVLVGLVSTLVALLDGLGPLRALLPTTPMLAWRGLWEQPAEVSSVWQEGLLALVYAALLLAVAARAFLRRDEAA